MVIASMSNASQAPCSTTNLIDIATRVSLRKPPRTLDETETAPTWPWPRYMREMLVINSGGVVDVVRDAVAQTCVMLWTAVCSEQQCADKRAE